MFNYNFCFSDVQFQLDHPQPPPSRCSLPCGRGQMKKYIEGESCCWTCHQCGQYQVKLTCLVFLSFSLSVFLYLCLSALLFCINFILSSAKVNANFFFDEIIVAVTIFSTQIKKVKQTNLWMICLNFEQN